MPLPVIAGVTRVAFRGSNVAGQQWANVMHFQYAGGASNPGPTEFTALDTKVLRIYTGSAYASGAAWFTLCPPDIKLIDATYYNLDGLSAPYVIPHTQAGTATAGTNYAQEVAMVVTLLTGKRGRRYRGRIYLPAPGSAAFTGVNGVLSSTNVALTLAQTRGMLADLASIQWAWGVASYGKGSSHGQPTSWAPFFTPLSDVRMDGVPDVQRRRKQ